MAKKAKVTSNAAVESGQSQDGKLSTKSEAEVTPEVDDDAELDNICDNVFGKIKHIWQNQNSKAFTSLSHKFVIDGHRKERESSILKPGAVHNNYSKGMNAFNPNSPNSTTYT